MQLTKILEAGCIPAAVLLIAGHVAGSNTPKKEARVTQIIRDVKLLPAESTARSAVVNDKVQEGTGVRTGDESRSELTFLDLTITRLGANTIFSFNKAGRSVELDSGSILLRVPKDSGGARMTASAVTVGITGTTVIFESTRSGRSKLTILEGGARLTLNKYPREAAYIHAGQMLDVKAGATKLPPPVDVDLNQIMKTSPLITDFPPLPSEDLIVAAARDQNPHVYQSQPVDNPPRVSGPIFTPWRPPVLGPGKPRATKPGGATRDGSSRPGATKPNVTTQDVSRSGASKPKASPTPSPRRKPSPGQPN